MDIIAQTSPALAEIHEHLQDWRTMAQQDGFVFVGEIETMRPVRTHRCQAGFENKVEYIVRDLFWSDVDSHVHKGYVVGKCFIDGTQKPLPAPLQEGSKVVVLCGIRLGSYTCLTAAEGTVANPMSTLCLHSQALHSTEFYYFKPVIRTRFAKHAMDMVPHGLLGELKLEGYFLISHTKRDQPH
jgi:hypothetical protein